MGCVEISEISYHARNMKCPLKPNNLRVKNNHQAEQKTIFPDKDYYKALVSS